MQLGIVDHFSVLYVYEMESPCDPHGGGGGGRAPLHCTAVGKVLLAFQPEEYVKQMIDRGLATYTSKTPTRRRQSSTCSRSEGPRARDRR